MSSRSNVLNRIRTALRRPAQRPPLPGPGVIFQPIASTDLLRRFENELLSLKAEFHCAHNWQDAQTWVKTIADKHELRRIVTAPAEDAIETGRLLSTRVLSGDNDCGRNLSGVDLGITTCDCLVAMTGSVVLSTRSGFGRALSILPPAHLVVARCSQVLPDLTSALRLLQNHYGKSWPSMITIITGPSRTADIEKILVIGAHGPKKLFVLLLDF